jgi:tetratricopeptide (TPR) repeat protein
MSATQVVGRDAQLAELDRFLTLALAGQASVCFVTGEPGAGKTSLVTQFAQQAQSRTPQLLVAFGACDAYTGAGDAYLPFREVLQQFTGDVAQSLAAGRTSREGASRLEAFARFAGRTLIENGADLVGVFVPGGALLTRLGGNAAKNLPWAQKLRRRFYDADEATAGRSLRQENVFEQYTQVLEAMAVERPLLLLLDDLHWADSASISLLFHLARRLAKSRIFIVGAYRSEELSRQLDGKPHPLRGVVAELTRMYGGVTLDLDNLHERGFVDALVDVRPNSLDERFRDSLARHTAGNPLFAVELLQSLESDGVLVETPEGMLVQVAPIEWRSLPSRVAGVIESRVTQLTAAQKDILAAAAVQGEEFVADVVARVVRSDRRDVVRELSGPLQKELRLVRAMGIQEWAGMRLARYRFRHNLVQDYFCRQLDVIERVELHGETGLALEEIHRTDPAAVAVQLAIHFTEAGDWARAVRYRMLAAEQAVHAYAHEQSIEHLVHALAIASRHGAEVGGSALNLASVHETLGDEFLVVRRLDDAADSYRAAHGFAEAAERLSRARLQRKLARVYERQSRYEDSTANLELAQVTLGDVDTTDPAQWWKEWIEIQLALSFVQYWRSDMTAPCATDARLQPVMEIWGSPVQRSQFHAARARRGLRQTRYRADAATLADAERAAASLEEYTDPFLRTETTFLLGFTQLWAGHLDEGGETLTRAAELSRRVGDAMHRVRSLVYLAVVRRRQGNVSDVGRLNDEARDLIRQLGSDDYQAIVLAEDAWLAWRRGAFGEATDAAAAAVKFCAEHTPNFPFQWPWLWVKLALDEQAGRVRDAAETAESMLRPSLAGQPANLEAQLRRIVAARSDDQESELKRELGHAVELAGAANYL